ncbi:hemoglobin, alpha embryonic 5 [Thalassophryne amazonica]|uniref:hemoglobin, alpha embryonic 5 n=1 Tax=Thalassophryne amazonica TaxID=390379 RepID=UPI001471CEB4|nr:hemoglobin, alpha embryonic 5 [Thalassophryne amazonica]XP_034050055.1 hemoglobin, alpha embryonic 5 [Thalassophryne amazonica]
MSLHEKDRKVLNALWAKISKKANIIGADAVFRMLTVYPQTKTYFAHWTDLSSKSASVRKHGRLVMGGVGLAMDNLTNLTEGLLTLSGLHAFMSRVDPANFKILAHCIMVSIAILYPQDFTPQAHVSLDKFMANLALALSEKYR